MTAATFAASTAGTQPQSDRRAGAHLQATIALTSVTVATAIGMCRLFADWTYLRPMLVVGVGTHALCLMWRVVPRLPAIIAGVFSVMSTGWLLAVTLYRDTLTALLPTGRTIDLFRTDLRLVVRQFPSAVAPVPSSGSFAIAATALLALAALTADTFAFRAFGRVEAIIPAGMVFTFVSAVGADRNRVAVTGLFCASMVIAAGVLRADHDHRETGWLGRPQRPWIRLVPLIAATAALAAVVSVWVAPRLPGAGEEALVDARNRIDTIEVVNPFVDIRQSLVRQSETELFTVSAGTPSYWRLTGLHRFDGRTWEQGTPSAQSADDSLGPVPPGAQVMRHTITIGRMGGQLIPAAADPVRVFTEDLDWSPEVDALVDSNGIDRGDEVAIESALVAPTADELRAATSINAPAGSTDLERPLDPDIASLAVQIVAGRTTVYARALALQNWFRSEFDYDLTVQPGHDDDAMVDFVRNRRGYCEQFAGTFAAMARSLGIPARVAVGFTPGELQADGRYHVRGRNAHAWAEVWFDGYGWVLFEPTPGRGAPGATDHTGVAPAQDETPPTSTPQGSLPPGGVPTSTTPARPDGIPTGSAAPPTTQTGGAPGAPTAAAARNTGSSSPTLALAIAAGVLLLALWVVLGPRLRAKHAETRRRGMTSGQRIEASWSAVVDWLQRAGSGPIGGATPLEFTRLAVDRVGLEDRPLQELARAVTAAACAPNEPEVRLADRCEVLERSIAAQCLDRVSGVSRWALRLAGRG